MPPESSQKKVIQIQEGTKALLQNILKTNIPNKEGLENYISTLMDQIDSAYKRSEASPINAKNLMILTAKVIAIFNNIERQRKKLKQNSKETKTKSNMIYTRLHDNFP